MIIMLPPNKRFICQGLYLPSVKSEELQNIVLTIDTSGSINQALLNQFKSEIEAILTEFQTELIVIYCDTTIRKIETFTSNDLPLNLQCPGGGGTDFKPPFEYIEKEGLNPACFIYLTDCQGRFPDHAPDYPVLWVNLINSEVGPFGETVNVNR